jgi:alpha-tubulin suppressor-like RCC1 family protein
LDNIRIQPTFVHLKLETSTNFKPMKTNKLSFSSFSKGACLAAILGLVSHMDTVTAQTLSVSGGFSHSLFLCDAGSVNSAGLNHLGQLGYGNVLDQKSPVKANVMKSIAAVSGGGSFSLFLATDSTVWACGSNTYGALGDGTNANRSSPVKTNTLTGIVAVAAGASHSLFLKSDGTVWASGRNEFGQLGDGTTVSRNSPVKLTGLSGIVAISAGESHSLFLKQDGTAWGCGRNGNGEWGGGNSNGDSSPVKISITGNIIAISAGGQHSHFLQDDSSVWACGVNTYGQLGDFSSDPFPHIPLKVNAFSGVAAIAGGGAHTLFLKGDGTVWSCGWNFNGQLGTGSTNQEVTPVRINSLSNVVAMEAGFYHSLFVRNDGVALACGENQSGTLGIGSNTDATVPQVVSGACSPVGINDLYREAQVSVYPNPAGRFLKVQSGSLISAIEIFNLHGEKVYASPREIMIPESIDLSAFAPGIYMVQVMEGNSCITRKIVVE